MRKIGHAFGDTILSTNKKARSDFHFTPSREFLSVMPLILLIVIFTLFAFRLFYLQVLRGSYYTRLSEENRTRTTVIPAPRGIIYDRKGRELVSNSPAYKLVVDENNVWIDKEEALQLIAEGKEVANDIRRDYLYKDTFAHVLGYVGQISEEEMSLPRFTEYSHLDLIGKTGLERQYETRLHGQNGRELSEVDSSGKIIRSLGKEDPIPGQNLTTTLDIDIQKAAFEAMSDVERGAVIVSDPRSGEILALVSIPSFDPNVFTHPETYQAKGDYKNIDEVLGDLETRPVLDRAIGGAYPPGSTYKMITSIAGLEEKKIDEDTIIEDTGFVELGGTRFGTWYYIQYGRLDGPLDVVKAIARSNDIFFYKTAEQVGIGEMEAWSRKFGLGEKLGIDIPGEIEGTVPSPEWKQNTVGEQWYTGDVFNMGIGQGYLLTTPLQVNAWTNVFANGGTLYRPHLVKEQKHVLNNNFIGSESMELVREGMKQSCETGGVAFPFFDFGVENENLIIDGKDFQESASASANFVRISVGCKTGTSETPGDDSDPHAWFTIFAPFHEPEVSVTILAENGGEGSQIAAPIARKILEEYFKRR